MAADSLRPQITDNEVALHAYLAAARPKLGAPEGVGAALRAALEAARAAWPDVDLSAERFVRFVAEKLPEGRPVGQALAELRTADLYLARACADGDARALARLDRLLVPVVDKAAARLGVSAEQAGEVRQRVRQLLLMPRSGEGGGPTSARIAGFSGRGALGAWVRVIAAREAVWLLRGRVRERAAEDDELARKLAPDAGPELAYFKRLYRDEFEAAFAGALEALSERERTLLRQHALDGLSIDRLAALYQVHRATAARWVDGARRAVLEHTRDSLGRRLRLRPGELDSVMRLIQSQLDVTLAPLLRDARPRPQG